MTLLPIVEGDGEVTAAPTLLRRLCHEQNRFDVTTLKGFLVPRGQLVKPHVLASKIEEAAIQRGADRILILFDADDDCPKELRPELSRVCAQAPVPTQLVIANREYEAWFLASMESLRSLSAVRDDAVSHESPEEPRDAKGLVSRQMLIRYSPAVHQDRFSAVFNFEQARAGCRSFRRLESAVEKLISFL